MSDEPFESDLLGLLPNPGLGDIPGIKTRNSSLFLMIVGQRNENEKSKTWLILYLLRMYSICNKLFRVGGFSRCKDQVATK